MLGFSLFAGAKSYQINGTAPGCEGKQLTVLFYEEYFTMKMTVDQTIFVQSDESFSFEIETNENALVIFRIESVNGQFYLGGETTYNIVFDISKANPPIRFTNTNWSSIQFVNLPETDINKRLEKLNGVHANYYKEYSSEIYQVLTSPNSVVRDQMNKKGVKADMIKLDDSQQIIPEEQDQANKLLQLFIKRLKASEFDPSGDDYESVSAKYMVGELESLLGRNSEDLFKNYLMDRSYLDNLEYVSFYKMYYRNVLEEVYQAELKEEFIGHLYNLHLDSIVISTDSILVSHNDDLEFALLCGIEAGFELPNVSSRDVTVLLELLSRQASPPYKEMAENYLYSLSKGKKGFIPENCIFMDLDETVHELEEFRGQFVYLSFFSTWNTESTGHQMKVKQLESKYGNRIKFISVCMDYDWDSFKEFLAENRNYQWLFLFGNTDKLLKEKLQLSTVPHYILLDPNGAVMLSFTPSPEDGVSKTFDRALRN